MSFKATLFIFGKEYPLLQLDYTLNQRVDYTGRPNSRVNGGKINVTANATKNVSGIEEAMFSPTWTIEGKIVVYKRDGMQKNFEIKFANTYLSFLKYRFNHQSAENLVMNITFSALIMEIRNSTYESPANPNNPFNKETIPITAKEEKEEKKVIDYYITDLNNKRIDKILVGDKILLNIHSKNMIDELFTIKLNNQTIDFKYDGDVLVDDTLSNYKIGSNQEKIELETIKQEV